MPAAVRRADFQHFFSDWEYRDITDEALARCYDHLERYRGLSQFQWWVLGYAKNILRNRIQRQLTHWRNQSLLERAADQHALCQDPLRLLLRLERDQFLREAFYQLPPQDQALVYQRVFFQTAYATLAKSAQLTRDQVRRRCQDALNALGYNAGSLDGKYGSNTISAVKKFQRNFGLTADGVCGCNTWKKLAGAAVGIGRTSTVRD